MRKRGESISGIAKVLRVSKSTVSIWCRGVVLTRAHIVKLENRMISGSYAGRLKGAMMNSKRRMQRIKYWHDKAGSVLGEVSSRDILMLGLGLYLGEGSKTKRQFYFTNSNPAIINACLKWLEVLNVEKNKVRCRVFINEMHRNRYNSIQEKWHNAIGIDLSCFNNPVFVKTRLEKQYENADTYLGVLTLRVLKSSELFYEILGLMDTFLYNIKAKARVA